jgi:MFS family permease
MLQLLDGSSFFFVVLFAAVYGVGAGGGMSLRAPIIREYFGTRNFGAIFGVTALMVTIGGVIGAPITGLVFDVRGTYEPIWFIYAGLTTVGTILLLLLPRSSTFKRVDRSLTA